MKKMNTFSRWILLLATLILLIAYFTPIWKIALWAPQYPEGLVMHIWINKLSGDIAIINGLNHYIGMANIEEAMFPELNFLVYLLGAIFLLGLTTFITRRKKMVYVFTLVLIIFAFAAMVDMYLWGYKYGHNLDPHAAIKIEGESYQPPLLGYKQLLNFTALSMPDKGGWALFTSTTLAILASVIQRYKVRQGKKRKGYIGAETAILSALLLLSSCQSGPEELNYGQDDCDYCGMKMVENKYGAEIITEKGRVYKFDDLNCMLDYESENMGEKTVAQFLVIDFSSPGKLIDATSAYFLKSDTLRSPMGANTAAFENSDSLERYFSILQGDKINWKGISKVHE